MKRKIVYVHAKNKVDQLKKTPSDKRDTFTYRFYGVETVNGRTREYVEKIELVPGEDDVTEKHIKALYSAEDHEVYENKKARRPERSAADKKRIEEWTTEFIRKFKAKNGYEPNPEEVKAAVKEAFPANWSVSLEGILEGEDGAGDKSAVLAKAYRASDSEPGAVEMMDEIASTWPESWREIYERVLKNGETIVSLARERGVSEGAVRKTVNKIHKALSENPELQKFVRFFD